MKTNEEIMIQVIEVAKQNGAHIVKDKDGEIIIFTGMTFDGDKLHKLTVRDIFNNPDAKD